MELEVGKYYSLYNIHEVKFVIKVIYKDGSNFIVDFMNTKIKEYMEKYLYREPILDTAKEITQEEYLTELFDDNIDKIIYFRKKKINMLLHEK